MISQQSDQSNLQIGVASLLNIFDIACALDAKTVSIPLLHSLPSEGNANTEQMAYWTVEIAHSLIIPQSLSTIRLCMPTEEARVAIITRIGDMMMAR